MPLTTSPPTELTQAQLAESRAPYIHGVVTIVTVLGTVGVTLRCISRRMSGTRFSYDDYLIFVALVSLYSTRMGFPLIDRLGESSSCSLSTP